MFIRQEQWFQQLISMVVAGGIIAFWSPFPKVSVLLALALALIFVSRSAARLKNLWRAAVCCAVFFGFLYFSAVSGSKTSDLTSVGPGNFYSQLSQNFFQGKLYLPFEPDPKLMALPNPYDPSARNGTSFTWDLSYYHGKYYLYWGVAPVLSLVAPFYLAASAYPTEILIGLWFAAWGAVFSTLLLIKLLEVIQKKPASSFQKYFGAIILLLSLPYGLLLRRPHIYEQALFSGHAYAMASLYFFLVLSTRKKFDWVNRAGNFLVGVVYGLALLSRPPYALMFPAFFAMSFFSNSLQKKNQFKYFFLGLIPMVGVLLAYNYFRFDTPFEFGFFYQLNNIDMSKWGFSWKDTAFAMGGFLFQWPSWTKEFPYAHVQRFGEQWINYTHRYMNDQVMGLFMAAPYAVFLLWDRRKLWNQRNARVVQILLVIGFLLMGISSTAGMNVRYEMEFLPFFVIPALVWALFEFDRTQNFIRRTLLSMFFLYSILLGFFLSFSIELNPFVEASPALYGQLKDWFSESGDASGSVRNFNVEPYLRNHGGVCWKPFPNKRSWFSPAPATRPVK